MKKTLFTLFCLTTIAAFSQKMNSDKKAVIASIENHEAELIALSDSIWSAAETAFQESVSSEVLASYAEKNGFNVERGVAGMPTAFVATYGSGKPVISILGEFDALPGISQKAQPTKDPLNAGAAGHGCGHNLFGTASLGAAIAVKELMAEGKFKGTIKFLGTPAEEKRVIPESGSFPGLGPGPNPPFCKCCAIHGPRSRPRGTPCLSPTLSPATA